MKLKTFIFIFTLYGHYIGKELLEERGKGEGAS